MWGGDSVRVCAVKVGKCVRCEEGEGRCGEWHGGCGVR